jgi:hypothetical protein
VTDLAGACGAEQLVTGCDCGGHDVTWLTGCSGLPQGYAPTMLAHVGSCLDASPGESDGGGPVPDASLPIGCSESKDCPTGEECGYEIELACSAAAQCLPYAAFGLCNSIMPACSCTGQTIGISGCASAVGQPIQHIGACAGQEGGL